jgi:hypothetical protein
VVAGGAATTGNVAEGALLSVNFRIMQDVVRAQTGASERSTPGLHLRRVSKGNSILPPFTHATGFLDGRWHRRIPARGTQLAAAAENVHRRNSFAQMRPRRARARK